VGRPGTGHWLRLQWEPDEIPYLGIWVDEGAVNSVATVALESPTASTTAWKPPETTSAARSFPLAGRSSGWSCYRWAQVLPVITITRNRTGNYPAEWHRNRAAVETGGDVADRPVLWIQRQRKPLLNPPARQVWFDVLEEPLSQPE
jgi:hypothetical protein